MGSRVVPTTATPDPRWFNTNSGTVRSTIRSIDRNECRQTDRQARKQTIKNEQCGSNPPKGLPQAESHKSVDSAGQGGYSWPIANWEQRYATYLQREIRTVPVRSEDGETRLGDRSLLRARAGATAQAAEAVGGAPPSPDWGEVAVRRHRSRPSGHARVGVGGGQLVLRVRSALARTRARAGESASAWAWGPGGWLTGDERRG